MANAVLPHRSRKTSSHKEKECRTYFFLESNKNVIRLGLYGDNYQMFCAAAVDHLREKKERKYVRLFVFIMLTDRSFSSIVYVVASIFVHKRFAIITFARRVKGLNHILHFLMFCV